MYTNNICKYINTSTYILTNIADSSRHKGEGRSQMVMDTTSKGPIVQSLEKATDHPSLNAIFNAALLPK